HGVGDRKRSAFVDGGWRNGRTVIALGDRRSLHIVVEGAWISRAVNIRRHGGGTWGRFERWRDPYRDDRRTHGAPIERTPRVAGSENGGDGRLVAGRKRSAILGQQRIRARLVEQPQGGQRSRQQVWRLRLDRQQDGQLVLREEAAVDRAAAEAFARRALLLPH